MKKALKQIAENILTELPFFQNHFVCTERDNTGIGISHSGEQIVFPADHLGNYFYLRPSGNIEYKKGRRVMGVTLVVYYQNACRDELYTSLENILIKKCGTKVGVYLKSALLDNVAVIRY